MYTAIKNFCENSEDNGLFLINTPTGSGKTYDVLEYICEASLNPNNKDKKYIFITNLKKNLPREDLEKHFLKEREGYSQSELKRLLDEKYIYIDNIEESLLSNYNEQLERIIPIQIRELDEYKDCFNIVKEMQITRKSNNKNLYSILSKQFRPLEVQFRNKIRYLLKKELKNVDAMLSALEIDNNWKWLKKLYPIVALKKKQIIFMSMDKFLLSIDTIVESPFFFYNGKKLQNTTIFIDEIDSNKSTILKRIIENNLKMNIAYVDLFNTIYYSLHNHIVTKDIVTSSKIRKEKAKENIKYKKSLETIIEDTKKKFDNVYCKYSLEYNHKTDTEETELPQDFLFCDHLNHTVLNGENTYIVVKRDKAQRKNIISFSKKKPKDENYTIYKLLGELRKCIRWFRGAVYILANNYRELMNERLKDGEDEFTLDQAIYTILSELGIKETNKRYQEYMRNMILSEEKSKNTVLESEYDLSFYENGFLYYSFIDKRNHNQESDITMVSFDENPEKLLVKICEKAKVIGISATATIPSVIGNFDLNYLKLKLGKNYKILDGEDLNRIKINYNQQQSGLENVNIHVVPIDSSNYSAELWTKLLRNEEVGKIIYNKLNQEVYDFDDQNYNKQRYYRIAAAYYNFIIHKDIHSFLCVLTTYPKENGGVLSKKLLEFILKKINELNNVFYNPDSIFYLEGSNFENNKNNLIKTLSESKNNRLFVISVYQAIGVGQNLQYPIPCDMDIDTDLIHIGNTVGRKKEKDFDAIYLEKPTYILTNIGTDNLTNQDFAQAIYQIEYLMENGEISQSTAFTLIKQAFEAWKTQKKPKRYDSKKKIYDSQSVAMNITSIINQSIGRTDRTKYKNKNIYYFADTKLADSLDYSILEGKLFSPIFTKFMKEFKTYSTQQNTESLHKNKAELITTRANRKILSLLKNSWFDITIQFWTNLRILCLKYPTMNSCEYSNNPIVSSYWVELEQDTNVLWYNQKEDYNIIEISFDYNSSMQMESSGTCNLEKLMRYPYLREKFVEYGYATSFKPNKYIMSPVVWNNIYKGVLGEICGLLLFKKLLEIDLKEIEEPEIFELFDYVIDNKDIYIDFKNWQETTDFDNKEMLEKISIKAEQCNAKLVIIANIIKDEFYETQITKMGNTKIVKCPCLLINDNGIIRENIDAIEKIRRCINEIN